MFQFVSSISGFGSMLSKASTDCRVNAKIATVVDVSFNTRDSRFIGDAECFLASVLGGLDAHETLDLDNEKMPQPGTVEIWAEEVLWAVNKKCRY